MQYRRVRQHATSFSAHTEASTVSQLARAGFGEIGVETRPEASRSPSARATAALYPGTPLRDEIEARDAGPFGLGTDRAAESIAARHGDGPVAGKVRAHMIVAAP